MRVADAGAEHVFSRGWADGMHFDPGRWDEGMDTGCSASESLSASGGSRLFFWVWTREKGFKH